LISLPLKYIVYNQNAFEAVDQATYGAWYAAYGIFYRCPNVDLGFGNNVFGGYCGCINNLVEDWKPFYLTYSFINIDSEVYSETHYFDSFTELANEYHDLLTLEWTDFSFMLMPGAFEIEVAIWDLF
jgi:hypothetical protein